LKKTAAALLSACLLLSGMSAASAAPVDHHHKAKHKVHAKSEHKMHMKKAEHKKILAKSMGKEKLLKEKSFHAKAVTPKALPKTGYGGVSE